MKSFLPYLLIVFAIGLTIFGGLLHGRISQRWGPVNALERAGQPLSDFPERIGDWTMRESHELPQNARDQLQCVSYVNRRYQNQQTGDVVQVAILAGPAGPLSVHEPEICYTAAGHTLLGDRDELAVRDPSGVDEKSRFWVTSFESKDVNKNLLHVCYAWTRDGRWEAPANARLAFAGAAYLYKMELSALLPPGSDSEDYAICECFLEALLPVFRGHVVKR